jgi:hypothetical protein
LEATLELGVIGNGTAKSCSAVFLLAGDFVDDREGDDGGTNTDADSSLGEAEAKVRVREEAFAAAVSCGRSAQGILGIGFRSSCSCKIGRQQLRGAPK